MITNPQYASHSKFSLQEELKRRKAAELQSEIELRRIMQATQPSDPRRITRTSQRTQAAWPARVAQGQEATIARKSTVSKTALTPHSNSIVVPLPDVNDIVPARRSLTRQQKQRLIGIVAALLIIVVILMMALLAAQPTSIQAASLQPLPTVSASDTLARLKLVGLPISNVETAADVKFAAQGGIKFSIKQGNDKGQVIVLSYATLEKAHIAAFRLSVTEPYKRWKQITASNILMLVSPDTAVTLQQELASHMTQYLVAPYRSFLPTATATLPAQGN
jgi:hypothetical protein